VLAFAALLVAGVGWSGYTADVVLGFGGSDFDLALLVAVVVGAALGCAVGGRSKRRSTWLLLSAAIVAYGVSAICYAAVPDAATGFPSVYDFGLFVFYPLVFASLVQFVRSRIVEFSAALWLDSLAAALATMSIGAMAVGPDLDSPVALGQFFYLLGDFGFLGFLVAAWALGGRRRDRSLLCLAVGAATLVLADGVYFTNVSDGILAPGALSLVLWPASLVIFAFAAFQRSDAVASTSLSWAKVSVPAVSACACMPVIFFSSAGSPEHTTGGLGLAFIVVRMALSLIENARLLAAAERSAITDPLTGLPNRQLLLDRLGQAQARQTRRGGVIAVLFIDLDEFKAINDSLGHEVGDQVLRAVSQRLSAALRREDTVARPAIAGFPSRAGSTVARLGGDEFVVLLEGLAAPTDATRVADRFLAELQAPLLIDEHQLFVEASVGITFGDGVRDRVPIEFLRDADIAMYAAKQAGKARYEIFETEMHAAVLARSDLVRDLRSAVNDGQLRLLYQPQVDVSSGRMVSVEALVRWEHPERGLLTPDRFIPVAETTGMIIAIDDWVLREACTQMRAWDEAGLASLGVAVNVSARRLVTGDLAGTIADVLRDTVTDPARLEIELTETVAVESDSEAVRAITRVRDLGVQVAIDDFGKGHSALSRLQTFPVDRLKIDKSFVAPLTSGTEGGSIAAAMIAMARSLNLRVVAEGVETPEHLSALQSLGCDCAQGYLFSKPVPAVQIARLTQDQAAFSLDWAQSAEGDGATQGEARIEEPLIRNLLAELQRLTGLDTTYLTRIDTAAETQHITHARNTAMLDIPEGLTVNWSDTICRRALDQGINYTDEVPAVFSDSQAATNLGLQTYVTVPLTSTDGTLEGTLCGASCSRVALGEETVRVMEHFATLISQTLARKTHTADIPARQHVLEDRQTVADRG